MNRSFTAADDGKRFRLTRHNGIVIDGHLEYPLADPAGVQAGVGILWFDAPQRIGENGTEWSWLYVSPDEVTPLFTETEQAAPAPDPLLLKALDIAEQYKSLYETATRLYIKASRERDEVMQVADELVSLVKIYQNRRNF